PTGAATVSRPSFGVGIAGPIHKIRQLILDQVRCSTFREPEVITVHFEPPGSMAPGDRWAPVPPDQPTARNMALRVTHAKYVVFIDSLSKLDAPFLGQ